MLSWDSQHLNSCFGHVQRAIPLQNVNGLNQDQNVIPLGQTPTVNVNINAHTHIRW
jgi:hypothetical protein